MNSVFGRAVYEVARKEVIQHVRTKRLLILVPAFLFALILLTIVLPLALLSDPDAAAEAANADAPLQNTVVLIFLSGFFFLSGYFYVQLIPIVLTADAVCSEWSNRTIFLLLSKPVSRAAFVVGKFAGSLVTVAGILVVCLVLDYAVLQFILPRYSSAEDWLRFAGALGILVLGAGAYTALALCFSTLTRSAVQANVYAIVAWIIGFPLLGKIDLIVSLIVNGPEEAFTGGSEAGIGWSQYLSPGESMRAATVLLAPKGGAGDAGFLSGDPLGFFGSADPALAVLALCVHIALLLGLSLLVVARRDFD